MDRSKSWRRGPQPARLARWCGPLLALSLGPTGAGCLGGDPERDGRAIALLLPFTGPDSSGAYGLERAVISVVEQVNEAKGLSGQPLRVLSADTHSTFDGTAAALEAVRPVAPIAVLGNESVQSSDLLISFSEELGIPFISPFVSAESDTVRPGFPWWRFAPSPSVLGESTATTMFQSGVRSVSLVYGQGDYHAAFVRAIQARLELLGARVLTSVEIDEDQADYVGEIGMLDLTGEKIAIVLAAHPAAAARFVNEVYALREARPVEWWLSPVLQSREFVQNSLPLAIEGARGIVPGVFPGGDAFTQTFEARWRGDPPSLGAHYYYDATLALVLGLADAQREWLDAAGADAPPSPPLYVFNGAMRRIFSGTGQQIGWGEVKAGLGELAAGRSVFYQGLTGPVSWTDVGERTLFLFSPWSIQAGEIQVAE